MIERPDATNAVTASGACPNDAARSAARSSDGTVVWIAADQWSLTACGTEVSLLGWAWGDFDPVGVEQFPGTIKVDQVLVRAVRGL